ncbi:hypothetical protein NDU88_001981 [Pleurodeles waltl]|uniref:Uncharacterized protein n=1 Tax=Pleurodeles waltl TaxID=8319 RepID=A0AAV7P8C7_PLEWA|nr:hypothetical protein NDU88_001981 [Pleurodeles waltl]
MEDAAGRPEERECRRREDNALDIHERSSSAVGGGEESVDNGALRKVNAEKSGNPQSLDSTAYHIPDGGRIFRLIATTALAHPLSARGSHSPAAKAADAGRLQHGLLQALHGSLAASPRIEAARASTGGRRRKN